MILLFKLLSVILIIKCAYGCNSNNQPSSSDANEAINSVQDINKKMEAKKKELEELLEKQKKETEEKLKQQLEELRANLTLEIAKNRHMINKVIKKTEVNYHQTIQELAGLNREVKSITEAMIYDADQNLLSEKHVDEFISELKSFTERAESIDVTYKQFTPMVLDMDRFNKKSLNRFIDYCFGYTSLDLGPIMENMLHRLTEDRGALALMTETSVEVYTLGTRRMSTLEYMTRLAHYMASCEIRSALMATGAKNMAEFLYPGDSFDREHSSYMRKMTTRLNTLIESIKYYAPRYSARYWIYDTDSQRIGNQYVYFYNAFKGIYIRDNFCENIGKKTVTRGKQTSHEYCIWFNKHECTEGTLHCAPDTQRITDVQICYETQDTGRLYEYVTYTTDQTRECNGRREIFKRDERCTNCECYCNHTEAHKHFSLDEMLSDVGSNKVLTGVRFSKHDGAIGLDIQQSILNIEGFVVTDTSEWIVNKAKTKFVFNSDQRDIHLGEIITDNGRVITGLRLREVHDGVELQLRITDLVRCSKNKTILSTTHKWISGNKKDETYLNLEKEGVGNSIQGEMRGPSSIQKFSNMRIRISPTSFAEDGAQSVVPYFDARKVSAWHPVALRGIGLAYKKRSDKYAGFITPYLVLAEYSSELDTDFLSLMARSYSNGRSIFLVELSWTFIVIVLINIFNVIN